MINDEKNAIGPVPLPLPSTDAQREGGTRQLKKKKEKITPEQRLAKEAAGKIEAQKNYVKKINKMILEKLKKVNGTNSFSVPDRSGSVMKQPIRRINETIQSDENFRTQVRIANALLATFDGTEIQVAINQSKTKIYISSNWDKVNEKLSENIKSFDDILRYCRLNLDAEKTPRPYNESQLARLHRHSQKLLRHTVWEALSNATITVPEADPEKGDGAHAELRNTEAIAKEENDETWYIAGTKVPCIACTITLKTINGNLDISLYITSDYIGMIFLTEADSYTPLKIFIRPKEDSENENEYIRAEADRVTEELLLLVAKHIPEDKGTMRNMEISAGAASEQSSYPDSESDAEDYTSGPIVRTAADMRRPRLM